MNHKTIDLIDSHPLNEYIGDSPSTKLDETYERELNELFKDLEKDWPEGEKDELIDFRDFMEGDYDTNAPQTNTDENGEITQTFSNNDLFAQFSQLAKFSELAKIPKFNHKDWVIEFYKKDLVKEIINYWNSKGRGKTKVRWLAKGNKIEIDNIEEKSDEYINALVMIAFEISDIIFVYSLRYEQKDTDEFLRKVEYCPPNDTIDIKDLSKFGKKIYKYISTYR